MELGSVEGVAGISKLGKRPWMTWSIRVKPINKDDATAKAKVKSKNEKVPINTKPLNGYQFFMKTKCRSVADKTERAKCCQIFLQQWRGMSQVEKQTWSDAAVANRDSAEVTDSSKMLSETSIKKSKLKCKNTRVLKTFVKDFFRTKKFLQCMSKSEVQKRSRHQEKRSESQSRPLSELFLQECSVILRQLDHQRK